MEDNWKEKIKELFTLNYHTIMVGYSHEEDLVDEESFTNALLEFGNLVFEATKKECAKKAKTEVDDTDEYNIEIFVDKDSILNIEKPNL